MQGNLTDMIVRHSTIANLIKSEEYQEFKQRTGFEDAYLGVFIADMVKSGVLVPVMCEVSGVVKKCSYVYSQ